MKNNIIIVLLMLNLSLLFSNDNNIRVELDLEKNKFYHRERILIRVNIKNLSSKNIQLSKDVIRKGPTIKFLLIDEDGKQFEPFELFYNIAGPSYYYYDIAPGAQVEFPLDDFYYDLMFYLLTNDNSLDLPGLKTGQYRVKGTLDHLGQMYESDWIKFEVVQSNSQNYKKVRGVYREVCAAIAEKDNYKVDSLYINFIDNSSPSIETLQAMLHLYYNYTFRSNQLNRQDMDSRFKSLSSKAKNLFLNDMPESRYAHFMLITIMSYYVKNYKDFDQTSFWSGIADQLKEGKMKNRILMHLGKKEQNGVRLIKKGLNSLQH